MTISRLRSSIAALLLCLPSATLLAAEESPTITEELSVRERAVLAYLGPDPALGPSELEISVGGVRQEALRLESIAEQRQPWNIVLWVDREMVSPPLVSRAAEALGQRAGALCDLGFVTVIAADPAPKTLVSGTRNLRDLDRVLGELAASARRLDPLSWPRPKAEDSLVKWAGLPDHLGTFSSTNPQLLLVVGGESYASAEDLQALADGRDETTTPFVRGVGQLGARLALDGWVVVGLVLDEKAGSRTPPTDTLAKARSQMSGEESYFIDLVGAFSAKGRKNKIRNEAALEPHLLPRLAPILEIVRITGGSLVSQTPQIDLALEELRDVRRIWFRVAEETPTGAQSLALRATGDGGTRVRAASWIRIR